MAHAPAPKSETYWTNKRVTEDVPWDYYDDCPLDVGSIKTLTDSRRIDRH